MSRKLFQQNTWQYFGCKHTQCLRRQTCISIRASELRGRTWGSIQSSHPVSWRQTAGAQPVGPRARGEEGRTRALWTPQRSAPLLWLLRVFWAQSGSRRTALSRQEGSLLCCREQTRLSNCQLPTVPGLEDQRNQTRTWPEG